MASQKIRIKLVSYDHQMVDEATERIVEAMKKAGAKIRAGRCDLSVGRFGRRQNDLDQETDCRSVCGTEDRSD